MIDVAVDTNVFIASLVEKDHFHEDAISFLEQINTKQCRAHISKIVLVEIAGAISRRIDEASAREAIEIMGSWITEGKVRKSLTSKPMLVSIIVGSSGMESRQKR